MASLKQDKQLKAEVEWTLGRAFEDWSDVLDLAQEWDEWDDASRMSWAVDWPIAEGRLGRLEGWAAHGDLTPAQAVRLGELLRLVDDRRPTLERLLAETSFV